MQSRLAAHVLRVDARAVLQQQPTNVNAAGPSVDCAAEYGEHEGSGAEDSCAKLEQLLFGCGG